MPINLNPGADTSLVTAATRAGLASAPPDYSKTFESVSENYHKTMMANADMWGKIMKSAATIGKSIKDDMLDMPDVDDSVESMTQTEGGGWLKDEFKRIQDSLRRTMGARDKREFINDKSGAVDENQTIPDVNNPLQNIPNPNFGKPLQVKNPDYKKRKWNWFSKEAKEERLKLIKERNDLLADLEHQTANYDAIEGFFTPTKAFPGDTGQVWAEATGLHGMSMNAAYLATGKGKVSANGQYFLYEKDERGKLGWTLMSDPTRAPSYDATDKTIDNPLIQGERMIAPAIGTVFVDGEKVRYDASEFKKMLTLKPPTDKNGISVLKKDIDSDMLTSRQLGHNSSTSAPNDVTLNQFAGTAKKHARNRAAYYTESIAGEGGASFFGETTGTGTPDAMSEYSANIYGALFHILPKDLETGQLKKEGILSEIEDTDNVPGISEGDFQNQGNMLRIQAGLFNTGNKYYSESQTGDAFEKWYFDKLANQFTDGYKNNPAHQRDGKTDGKGLGSIKESGMFEGGSDSWMSTEQRDQITTIANKMDAKSSIGKGKSEMLWDDVRKSYFWGEKVMATKEHLFETIFKKQLTRAFKTSPFYTSITDWDGKQYLPKKEKKDKPGTMVSRAWKAFWE